MKVKKGDRIIVLSGKDKGKEGEVSFALPDRDRVIVEGINIAHKHQKARSQTMQAGIIEVDMPIHVSNVAVICDACGEHGRVGHRVDSDGKKFRICKKCGADL